MLTFLGRRLTASCVTIAIASTLVFLLIHMLPGDPVVILLGEQGAADPDVVARIRAQLNLDKPLHEQYVTWITGIAIGDLGESLQSGLPVAGELARRIPRSLEIILGGLILASLMGLPLGIVAARHADRPIGWAASGLAVVGFSSPIFVTGVLLVITISLWLGLLPSSGYVAFAESPIQHVRFAVLPIFTIAFSFMGVITRMTRASLSEVLERDYIRTARAKGLSQRSATYRHALPNALIPVIAIIGVRAGNLLGGTVIVEALFDWPGLSSLLVRACFDRDYPMIQGALLAIFVIFMLISLAADLAQVLIDPKLRR